MKLYLTNTVNGCIISYNVEKCVCKRILKGIIELLGLELNTLSYTPIKSMSWT